MESKIAVVTGANKGIGFEIVKGLCKNYDGIVILTARNEARGRKAIDQLNKLDLHPVFLLLDVTVRESIEQFYEFIKAEYGGVDILVNNAGALDFNRPSTNYVDAKKLMDTNFYSLLTISEILYPLLRNNSRVINISSDWGLLSNIRKSEWLNRLVKNDLTEEDIKKFVHSFLESAKEGKINSFAGTYGDYKVSKVAMSALTFVQQRGFLADPRNISINCVHPGFVKTDMTHGMGEFGPERGAKAPLFLALIAPQSLKGSFVWHDCSLVNWDD